MNSELLKQASSLIAEYTSGSYIFQTSCTDQLGKVLADFGEGRKISLIMSNTEEEYVQKLHDKIKLSFATHGLSFHGGIIKGANSDALVEDVLRVASLLEEWEPDIVVIVGDGGAISAGKLAALYWKLKSKFSAIQDYEKPNIISDMFVKIAKHPPPIVAFNTSISTSHIDCFADIYFSPQKRIMHLEDPALRPLKSFFDPRWTMNLSSEFVKDAAIDAFSHCLETYITYSGEYEEYLEYCCVTALSLVLGFIDSSVDSDNVEARAAIAMASDIGAISLMTAKANCGHLISDFCDIANQRHSTICSILNPYFMIMFSSGIGEKIAKIAEVFSCFGYNVSGTSESSRALSESLADAIFDFYRKQKLPVKLSEIPGFSEEKLDELVEIAKKNLAKSGFKQVPVDINLINATKYLRLLFEAAFLGDYSLIITP